MVDSRFFTNHGPFALTQLVEWTGCGVVNEKSGLSLTDVAPLDRADSTHISFFDNPKYIEQFAQSKAGACFVKDKFISQAPKSMTLLLTEDPYRCYAMVAQHFYPRKIPVASIAPSALIAPTAKIGQGCLIEAGVVIGENVEIGAHCIISANSVIDQGVKIGEHCQIGSCTTLSHTLIGNHVIIHRGVNIGQDGFGFALGRAGHVKVPQLGRVVIEDEVEIGSGTCIDRGTGPDTHIGAGTKIDNLVQIGHNVQIGRGCVIVAQTGIAGSTKLGDGVVLGGQVGLAGHLKIGNGAKVAAQSGVMEDIPAGTAVGGSPSVHVKDWHRQTLALAKLAKSKS